MKFEILLSTYNGEKYLEELLLSLLKQTYTDFHILIRDDGSVDGTVTILRDFKSKYPEKITLILDDQKLGYPDCFWYLLDHAQPSDMYAFCDQDDVWKEDKLQACYELCKGHYQREPILFVHDYAISDGDLHVYSEYHMKEMHYRNDYSYNLIYFVMNSGFTMILNERLRARILRDEIYHKALPHDRWVFWCGFFAGKIIHDERLLAIYRRHEKTETNTGKGNAVLLRQWWNNDIKGNQMVKYKDMAAYFIYCYQQEIEAKGPDIAQNWRLIIGMSDQPFSYFKRLLFPKRLKPTFVGELILRISFLLNK